MFTQPVRRAIVRATVITGAATLAISLSGCGALQSLLPSDAETRDAESGEITEGGTTDVFTLAVGDCLDDQSLAESTDEAVEVTSVPTVPCADPHDYEVFTNVVVPEADSYPGEDVVTAQAETDCAAAFPGFVGLDYESSIYGYSYYYPTSGSWSEGDRTINCLIGDPAGKTSGSLAGIAR